MQIKESATVYDAIIVGSGAGGGMATKILADAGLKVAVVEAGPFVSQSIRTAPGRSWRWRGELPIIL